MASEILSDLKKIQAKTVRLKVVPILMISFIDGKILPFATVSRLSRLVLKIIEGKINKAFMNPHAMNVQLAPCQKPLTIKIIKVFLTFIQVPPLLPPHGMYK